MPTHDAAEETGTRSVVERRRRPRLVGETTGWLLPAIASLGTRHDLDSGLAGRSLPDDEAGWEVRLHDVSRLGVGFTTTEPLAPGDRRRLRIGRGPAGRARPVKVVVCRRADDGTFHVGAEFADAAAHDRPARRLAKAG